MAAKKKPANEKFVNFVNKNIGKSLTTERIAKRTGVSVRRIQVFCKKIREDHPKKGKFTTPEGGHTIHYVFKRQLKLTDLTQ